MAVFTQLSDNDIKTLLKEFYLGEFLSSQPITAGIENTNYFLETTKGHWVLTIFERLKDEELPFYLNLCEHLAKKGCRVARPQKSIDGKLFTYVKNKPVSIANRIDGKDVKTVGIAEARSMGQLLGKMHQAAIDFPFFQKNLRGLDWWIDTAPKVIPFLNDRQVRLLSEEIAHQKALSQTEAFKQLTVAACHCDLFKNNALVTNPGKHDASIAGVFDFYFAGCSPVLFDLAVTMNDWCIDPETGCFNKEIAQVFIEAYNKVNPLGDNEKLFWRDMLRAAALRFWMSRLFDFYLPRKASLLKPHDPTHFERILENRQTCELPWPRN